MGRIHIRASLFDINDLRQVFGYRENLSVQKALLSHIVIVKALFSF